MKIMNVVVEYVKLVGKIALGPISLQKWTHGTGFGPGIARIGQGISGLGWLGVLFAAWVSGRPLLVLGAYLGICALVALALVLSVLRSKDSP